MRMTTALSTSDQRVVLQGVRWETYERLLADQQESSGTRLTYDCGTLEIMSPSFGHENLNRSIARLFELLASEMEMDFLAAGSTTFRRSDLLKGFEPDSSYYIRNIDAIRNPDEIDLSVDPPPDLVIEVEVTNPVISKLPIFAAAGVPEVWLYRDDRIEVLALESGTYHQKNETSFLPGVTDSVLSEFVKSSRTMKSTAWTHSVRAWVTNR